MRRRAGGKWLMAVCCFSVVAKSAVMPVGVTSFGFSFVSRLGGHCFLSFDTVGGSYLSGPPPMAAVASVGDEGHQLALCRNEA